jgi:D-aminopeptidase
VAKAGEVAPLALPGPIVMEIEREEPWPAEIRPGAKRVDAFTISYAGDSFWSVFHHHVRGRPDLPMPE